MGVLIILVVNYALDVAAPTKPYMGADDIPVTTPGNANLKVQNKPDDESDLFNYLVSQSHDGGNGKESFLAPVRLPEVDPRGIDKMNLNFCSAVQD